MIIETTSARMRENKKRGLAALFDIGTKRSSAWIQDSEVLVVRCVIANDMTGLSFTRR
ncbi:MAG: hypothetical protein KJZ83_21575 [Burkholderiaceae bacterium]|nr:hypothetical protein [Burkholderiaceae bacterium]